MEVMKLMKKSDLTGSVVTLIPVDHFGDDHPLWAKIIEVKVTVTGTPYAPFFGTTTLGEVYEVILRRRLSA